MPVPVTVVEIRRTNLRRLRDSLPGDERGKQRGMAELLGMSESQLSQLIGKTPTKPIGDRLARRIESRFNLPRGTLDNENHGLTRETLDMARSIQGLTPDRRRALKAFLDSFKK